MSGSTVVFVHAHPDDEAIFTGVTMRSLADAGARVVLVTATPGDLGERPAGLPTGTSVAAHRTRELEDACGLLGVSRLVLLGRRDSGCLGWPDNDHPSALMRAVVADLGRTVADLVHAEGADSVVGYDQAGIYGHPDHVVVHHVARIAADLAGVTRYDATVDNEHLARTGTHLVLGAAPATGSSRVGVPAQEVTVTVRGTAGALLVKRAAMGAHSSQISAEHLARPGFAAAYQHEWYQRSGLPGSLELLDGAQSPRRPAA